MNRFSYSSRPRLTTLIPTCTYENKRNHRLTQLALILALTTVSARAQTSLEFVFSTEPELAFPLFQSDTAQISGSTWTFTGTATDPNYSNFLGLPYLITDNLRVEVVGSGNPMNNGVFTLSEEQTGDFALIPSSYFFNTAGLIVNNFGGKTSFSFGDISVAEFLVVGLSLDPSIAPGDAVDKSHVDGMLVYASRFSIDGVFYRSPEFVKVSAVPELASFGWSTALLVFVWVFSRRRCTGFAQLPAK